MLLYVLRHGKAGEGYPDELRELTQNGRDDVRQVVTERSDDISPPVQIQASPLVRAQQTAEIVADVVASTAKIETNECLTPWSSPMEFLHSLDDSLPSVLIASHQPFVSELVAHLTDQHIAMPTSTLVAIELNYPAEGGGTLLWLETK